MDEIKGYIFDHSNLADELEIKLIQIEQRRVERKLYRADILKLAVKQKVRSKTIIMNPILETPEEDEESDAESDSHSLKSRGSSYNYSHSMVL